ncbi:MAG: Unknown protein [uncultured Sulfurovum sp.]|uniref:YhcG N-terminal domain-containing protein n=1 Tax=uncultured Sulfurovum sp. TaxID=269237 RepID=A0A6S6STP3_9BACT|nr:MAG: Unknown protein [uncultured Sulfurovum sp.]
MTTSHIPNKIINIKIVKREEKIPNIESKKDISTLYSNIKTIIDTSKKHAAIQINNTMIISYWEIGERLKIEVLKDKRAVYGQEVVKRISKE